MDRYVLGLHELDRTQLALAGGKGANLGELMRIDGVRVPKGFVVTTAAFRAGVFDDVRAHVEHGVAYAVRSSATAEDLPTASFAGQQDSFLNVVGPDAVVRCVKRCWDSLFTERAVAYRRKNGIDDAQVQMAVVVQEMVAATAAGVLFTAHPITGHRKVSVIEAVPGLGDALVSGHTNASRYEVREGSVSGSSGVLTTAQALELAALGRRIEAHFGAPQDIEWCLDSASALHVVQARPITTLFPIPPQSDGENHLYISVGHSQMMTDAMRPLGLSMWQLTTARPMAEAAGRLFVDVTRQLASPAVRPGMLQLFGRGDPLMRDALDTVLARTDFPLPPPPAGAPAPAAPPGAVAQTPLPLDSTLATGFIARFEASLAAAKRDIAGKAGRALFDFIVADQQELKKILFDPQMLRVVMASIESAWWLNDHLQEWLGEKGAADVLAQSVPGNVTSEMGLALLDVADVVRAQPEAIAALERGDALDAVPAVARDAIAGWLEKYGMRCVGEIDLTRTRWSEQPTALFPLILGNVKAFAPGEAARRFAQGQQEAAKKEHDVLARLRTLPDGAKKAEETKQMIDRLRTFAGFREYPKYAKVARDFLYKQALLGEARRLGFSEPHDIYFLLFEELRDGTYDAALIARRKEELRTFEKLSPPRVLTSDGEGLSGSWHREVPSGALPGLPVSAGIVEGRARVILDIAGAQLEAGDILVTAFTDPSWTPVFVSIKALVTQVGGQMTHGAVIAREYGLPAVVGVTDATTKIRDGQRIRVNGTDGWVELLS